MRKAHQNPSLDEAWVQYKLLPFFTKIALA